MGEANGDDYSCPLGHDCPMPRRAIGIAKDVTGLMWGLRILIALEIAQLGMIAALIGHL